MDHAVLIFLKQLRFFTKKEMRTSYGKQKAKQFINSSEKKNV